MSSIDIAERLLREGLVPVLDVPKLLPAAASGRRLHRASAWRWVRAGMRACDGRRVFLEAVQVGKRWMTSLPAVARFFAARTAASPNETQRAPIARAALRAHGLARENL